MEIDNIIERQKFTKLLSILTKQTATRELEWIATSPPDLLTQGTTDIIPMYFEARFKSRRIGLALRRYQLYDGDREVYTWNESVTFLFLDYLSRRVLWDDNSGSTAIINLFEIVKKRAAGLEDILDDLLSEDHDV